MGVRRWKGGRSKEFTDYCPAMQTLTTHSFVVKEHLLEGQKVGEREQHVKYLLTNLIFVRPIRSRRQGGGERIQNDPILVLQSV